MPCIPQPLAFYLSTYHCTPIYFSHYPTRRALLSSESSSKATQPASHGFNPIWLANRWARLGYTAAQVLAGGVTNPERGVSKKKGRAISMAAQNFVLYRYLYLVLLLALTGTLCPNVLSSFWLCQAVKGLDWQPSCTLPLLL